MHRRHGLPRWASSSRSTCRAGRRCNQRSRTERPWHETYLFSDGTARACCRAGNDSMNYTISTEPGARLRIDKWLWAARFFKTRSLAADAVEKGHVRIGGAKVETAKSRGGGGPARIQIEAVFWQGDAQGVRGAGGSARGAAAPYAGN